MSIQYKKIFTYSSFPIKSGFTPARQTAGGPAWRAQSSNPELWTWQPE